MVQNVGLTEKQLPFIYLTGGLCTFFSMNLVGRWADRSGNLYVFTVMSLSATIPITALIVSQFHAQIDLNRRLL